MAPRAAASASDSVQAQRSASGLLLEKGAKDAEARAYVPREMEPYNVPHMGDNYKGPLGANFADKPLLARLNWLHVPLLTLTPLIGLFGICTTAFNWRTYLFAVVYYFISGLGITAGYHRHFAHRAYKATPLMRVILMLMGTAAVEGSVRWWSRDHRAHHKYVDTPKDPYSAVNGFFFAHMGWMLVKQDPSKIGRADISDLNADPMLRFQHKWYLPLAIIMGVVVPTLVAGLGWGDYRGGYFIAGVARLVFVHHSTFFVNSLAHFAGAATYTDGHTARNSIITAVLTLGEGYHNFHHEFPTDFRNGVEWWQYDPTKVFIWACSLLGLTYDLNTFPGNEIVKGQLQMKQKALDESKKALYWGPNPAMLRAIKKADFDAAVAGGAQWAILDGFVLDMGTWADQHPGGKSLLTSRVGTDITEEFKGGFYKHSNAGKNLAQTLRIARIDGYWAQ